MKTTRKRGGAVDTHGTREQWLCVFVYEVDNYSTVPKQLNAVAGGATPSLRRAARGPGPLQAGPLQAATSSGPRAAPPSAGTA